MGLLKKVLIAIVLLAIVGIAAYGFFAKKPEPAPIVEVPKVRSETIGTSVEGRKIEAHTYGNGSTSLLFVGGIHGGYEWNTVVLAYQFMDYLKDHPEIVPQNLSVTVIPSLNPDGVFKVVGKEWPFTASDVSKNKDILASGRFNGNNVDLNRNFACKWDPKGVWQSKAVGTGSKAFSEPEAAALRDFVEKIKPQAAVFWHSQANAVYASECEKGILPKTLDVMNAYAKASGYDAVKKFDAYEVHGDAEGWLASINIPAVSVELKTHETVEFEQNLAGVKALFTYYAR